MRLWEERKKRRLRSMSKAENSTVSASDFSWRERGTSENSLRLFIFGKEV